MSILKANFLDISLFQVCKIDGRLLSWILKEYKKEDLTPKLPYKLRKFEKYLEEYHNITMKEYCVKYLNVDWPKCEITGLDLGYCIDNSKGVIFNGRHKTAKITKENSQNFAESCKKLSQKRMGKGNPMYGKKPWNKGLTTDSSEKIVYITKKTSETKNNWSEEKKSEYAEKQRKNLFRRIEKNGPIHHTPHSEETKEKLRKNTASLYQKGVFNRRTSIEIKVSNFLDSLKLKEEYIEQFHLGYYSLDFAFESSKIVVECNGTFFHVDPRFYPDGPINAVQRRNYGRDTAKYKFLESEGWKVIVLWETEINNGDYKKELLCKLEEFGMLNQLESNPVLI